MEAPEEKEEICVSCGLCCDGTIFTRVPVEDEDTAPYEALGLLPSKGKTVFLQPCCALDSQVGCTRYATRPKACRAFNCKLLQKYERGDIERDEALRIISQAQGIRDQIVEVLDSVATFDKPLSLERKVNRVFHKQAASSSTVNPHVAYAQTALQYATLQMLLTKHFCSPKEVRE